MRQVAVAAVLVALAIGVAPSVAYADDEAEITAMAKEHYKLGLDAYKSGRYPEAIKELKKAYLLKRLPALLLNIGATYRKMNDADNAIYYYKKYLAEAPDARDRPEVERTLADVEREKRDGGGMAASGGGGGEASPPAESAPTVSSWAHTPLDAVPPGSPVDVRVKMPVMRGVKVYVYYRGAGESDFTSVLMRRKGNEKVGRIPAEALAGKSFQYYIEGKDDRGSVVKSFGSPSSPNIVSVDATAQVQAAAEASDDDAPAGGARRDLDDEEAPIMGSVAEPKGSHKHAGSAGERKSAYGAVFWAGAAVAVVGVAGVAIGSYGLYQAHSYANVLTTDSQGDPSNHGAPFQFNDPNATPYDDKTVEHRGQLWNEFGLGFMIPGGVLLATGVVLMIVDQTVLRHPAQAEKPKKHSSQAWFVSPTGGSNNVGLAAGGSF
jgi:hypothetical protein